MSLSFFQNLPGFTSFDEACDPKHYHPAPSDWFIVVTDVQGSTKAIETGRYKDVNMLGAACIAAVVNTCEQTEIPYVFGGDGATFLIPPQYIKAVEKELLAVAKLAQRMHDLTLRCGTVPMAEISKHEQSLGVAKFVMPTQASLAMFNGGGAALADSLVKQNDHFAIQDKDNDDTPDLEGLSCRWRPLPNRHGTILTLLVMVTSTNDSHDLYQKINNHISTTLLTDQCPVTMKNLAYKWPGLEALRQSQMVWRQGNILKNLIGHIFLIILFNIMNRLNIKLQGLDVPQYRDDMILNSDYRKFDGMLRMVVDCTAEQATDIESYLKQLYEAGHIVYGTHYSDTALMTCFVQSLQSDKHVHFIDGNDGGYAMAAKKMKDQLAACHDRAP